MTRAARFLTVAAAAVLSGAAVAGGLAAPSTAPPMHVTLVIAPAGHDESARPANFAVRAGGSVTLTLRNETRVFHTFTIPGLGISVLLRPLHTTSVTFVVPYGVYRWGCVICASGAHPHMHQMGGKMYAIINA